MRGWRGQAGVRQGGMHIQSSGEKSPGPQAAAGRLLVQLKQQCSEGGGRQGDLAGPGPVIGGADRNEYRTKPK